MLTGARRQHGLSGQFTGRVGRGSGKNGVDRVVVVGRSR